MNHKLASDYNPRISLEIVWLEPNNFTGTMLSKQIPIPLFVCQRKQKKNTIRRHLIRHNGWPCWCLRLPSPTRSASTVWNFAPAALRRGQTQCILGTRGYKAPKGTPARENDDTFVSFSQASKIPKTPVQELDRRLPSRPSSIFID